MARYNPLKFPGPDERYPGMEFSPKVATDGVTPVNKTWVWTPIGNFGDGTWVIKENQLRSFAFTATPPMKVTIDPTNSKVTYGFEMNEVKQISYTHNYDVDFTVSSSSHKKFVINGNLAPELQIFRGDRYRFDYNKALDRAGQEFAFAIPVQIGLKTTLYELVEGVERIDGVLYYTIPGDAPDKLYYYSRNAAPENILESLTEMQVRDKT